jgi:hypothetical protein
MAILRELQAQASINHGNAHLDNVPALEGSRNTAVNRSIDPSLL